MVIVRQGTKVILKAKDFSHAINLFASKQGYDLLFALQNDGYTIERVEGN